MRYPFACLDFEIFKNGRHSTNLNIELKNYSIANWNPEKPFNAGTLFHATTNTNI